MTLSFVLLFLFFFQVSAHVPSLLLPIKGTPITSYFIGQSDISRAIYSELTAADNFFILTLNVSSQQKQRIEILTPVCDELPQYEVFQPSALVVAGDLPWKRQGESNHQYITRLESQATVKIDSNYSMGGRPQFYEEYGDTDYWVGGLWKGSLESGLYSIIVFDRKGNKGNFNISINEKEAWTPDLYNYVADVLPKIKAGFCNPKGFTGELSL